MRLFCLNIVVFLTLAVNAAEQVGADIRFSLLPVAGDELSEQVVTTVDTKLRQALTRTEAVTDNPVSAFAVRPTLSVSDAAATEGMMMDMTRVKGELTLASFGTIDGNVYYSVTIPLTATATGSREDAMRKLAHSIKPTDPVFVRFVRKSREKIVKWYEEHGDTIYIDLPGEPQEVPAPVAEPAEPVEEPVEVVPAPEVPAPVAPAPAEPKVRLKLSHPDAFGFKVLSCRGLSNGAQVKILCELVNYKMNWERMSFTVDKAFDENGYNFEYNDLLVRNSRFSDIDVPRDVPVKIELTIRNVKPSVKMLSYLCLKFDRYSVEIYDLPIKWE